ncbi:hypothetical protein Ait01nite_086080 [Actinoplanes italicus]|uniref:hypothetical protein n=1 Tax=Actinoplanes italicus TaxID=113567 RepID=UPI0019448B6B|nr:hypothetical protein [Actinoplanes italicus]GIE35563.1 hypothetical protein Ait01nite_086080 [Actinoplanes italicus]
MPNLIRAGGEMFNFHDRPGAGGPLLRHLVLPLAGPGRTVLVAGPHPDDLITGLVDGGAEVTWVLRSLADAEMAAAAHPAVTVVAGAFDVVSVAFGGVAGAFGVASGAFGVPSGALGVVSGAFGVVSGAFGEINIASGYDLVVAMDGLGRLNSAEGGLLPADELLDRLTGAVRSGGAMILMHDNQLGFHHTVRLDPGHRFRDDAAWSSCEGPASRGQLTDRLTRAGLVVDVAYAAFPEPSAPAVLIGGEVLGDVSSPLRPWLKTVLAQACTTAYRGRPVLSDPRRLIHRALLAGAEDTIAGGWLVVAHAPGQPGPAREWPDVLVDDVAGVYTLAEDGPRAALLPRKSPPNPDGQPVPDSLPVTHHLPDADRLPGADGLPDDDGLPGGDGVLDGDGVPGGDAVPGGEGLPRGDGMLDGDGVPGGDAVPGSDAVPGDGGMPGADGLRRAAVLRPTHGRQLEELLLELCATADVRALRHELARYESWLTAQATDGVVDGPAALADLSGIGVTADGPALLVARWEKAVPVRIALVRALWQFAVRLITWGRPHPWPITVSAADLAAILVAMAGPGLTDEELKAAIELQVTIDAAEFGLGKSEQRALRLTLSAVRPGTPPVDVAGYHELTEALWRQRYEASHLLAMMEWTDDVIRMRDDQLSRMDWELQFYRSRLSGRALMAAKRALRTLRTKSRRG